MNFHADYVPGPGTVLIWLSYDDNLDLFKLLISLTPAAMKPLRWSMEDRKRYASHFGEAMSEFGAGKSAEELDDLKVPLTLPVEDAAAVRDFLSKTIGTTAFGRQPSNFTEPLLRAHGALSAALRAA